MTQTKRTFFLVCLYLLFLVCLLAGTVSKNIGIRHWQGLAYGMCTGACVMAFGLILAFASAKDRQFVSQMPLRKSRRVSSTEQYMWVAIGLFLALFGLLSIFSEIRWLFEMYR